MCSYNRVNGTQTCESTALLDTLKHDWGFNGFVVPDFAFAVRDGLAAANAGVDFPALPGDFTGGLRTREMFTSGQITAARLDDMVRRILFAMFDSGVYDDPVPATPAPVVSTPEHKALATRISESGMVLLKNDDHALPLGGRHLRSLAVIGPSGDDAIYINGGSAAVPVTAGPAITPLAGITARAGAGVQLNVAQGSLGDVPLPTTVPSDVLTPASGTGHGLLGRYWSNGEPAGRRDAHPGRSDRRRRGRARRPRPGLVGALDRHADAAGDRPVPAARCSRRGSRSSTWTTVWSLRATARARSSSPARSTPRAGRCSSPRAGRCGSASSTRASPGCSATSIQLQWQPPSASGISAAVDAARRSDTAVVLRQQRAGRGHGSHDARPPR